MSADYCLKVLPEYQIDYTPVLMIPYKHLPSDLKLWEERKSWLLSKETRNKIKAAGGSLVAKSLEKDENKCVKIWRLSLNYAPVLQVAYEYFLPNCDIKKVLRLLKDIKQVALKEEEKDFMKSYNVKHALLWSVHENPKIKSEEQLLICVFKKIVEFYEKGHFPSFLEEKRNLVFKMSRTGKLERATNKIEKVSKNLTQYLRKIKRQQESNEKEVEKIRNILSYISPILLFPFISKMATEMAMERLNKDVFTKERTQRFYFEDDKKVRVKVLREEQEEVCILGEKEALKWVLKDLIHSILKYLTKGKNNEVIKIEYDEDNLIPCISSEELHKEDWGYVYSVLAPVSIVGGALIEIAVNSWT